MTKIHSHLSKWGAKLGPWEVVFFVAPEEILYSFFSFLSDISWNSIFLTVYKYELFLLSCHILSQLLLSWAELPKSTSTILMENCNQVNCLGL